MITHAFLDKYDTRVPRYTSYPTAPHFTEAVTAHTTESWLRALPQQAALSLYLHVPFCEELCLYCGCNTAVARNLAPRIAYAGSLGKEIALTTAILGAPKRLVTHIHWGGGTPTALPAASLIALMAQIRAEFDVAPDAEIAIELDPRHLPADRLDALRAIGITRASLGVQDFDPAVQRAVGRIQSFATTALVAQQLRDRGIHALNLDLMYGLPFQSTDSVRITAHQALALKPDRIAVFGYAHVPWMKRHQKLLPESELPDALARFQQREAIAAVLLDAGYQAIGLDHFALPDDPLSIAAARKTLHRNFQGYTTDSAPALLGFGASSISSLPQGYAQNLPSVPAYRAAVAKGRLPVTRGIALSAEDFLRRDIIQTLMCDFTIDLIDTAMAHHADPAPPLAAAPGFEALVADGLMLFNGRRITVTRKGQPFVRSIAALFDRYLQDDGAQRHARAV